MKSDDLKLPLASVAIHLSACYAHFQIAINLFSDVTIAIGQGLFIINSEPSIKLLMAIYRCGMSIIIAN